MQGIHLNGLTMMTIGIGSVACVVRCVLARRATATPAPSHTGTAPVRTKLALGDVLFSA